MTDFQPKSASEVERILREHVENDAKLAARKHTGKLYGELLGYKAVQVSRDDLKAMAWIAGFLLLVVLAALWVSG